MSPSAQFAIISADELSLLNLSIYQYTKTQNDDLFFTLGGTTWNQQ